MQNANSKHPCVFPDSLDVILDSLDVILDSLDVIPDSIRDPAPRQLWIADRACPGLRSGVRNDHAYVIPDPIRDPFTHGTWIADQVRNNN